MRVLHVKGWAKTKRLVLVLMPLCILGCLPVLVGGLIYKSSKSSGQKQEFMAQLQRTNADRESKGLKPLDWCSQAYRFDKGWAWEDTNCRARIQRYEKGDITALDPASQDVLPAQPDTTHISLKLRP